MRCEISTRRNPTVAGVEAWSLPLRLLHQEGGAGRQQCRQDPALTNVPQQGAEALRWSQPGSAKGPARAGQGGGDEAGPRWGWEVTVCIQYRHEQYTFINMEAMWRLSLGRATRACCCLHVPDIHIGPSHLLERANPPLTALGAHTLLPSPGLYSFS